MPNKERASGLSVVLIPGLVFLSVVTGGGFATGREMVQYFIGHGLDGLLGLVVVCLSFGVLFYLTAELARRSHAFDYRSWSRELLGRMWISLDILFIAMAVLVCAVVISGASEVLTKATGLDSSVITVVIIVATALITAFGQSAVLGSKSIGSLLLFGGYCVFAVVVLFRSGEPFAQLDPFGSSRGGWVISAFQYIGYNTVVLPACLYSLTGLKSKRDSMIASIITALCLMLPMMFVCLSISSGWPGVSNSPVPLYDAITNLGTNWIPILYYIILAWTLVDTGVGMVYAIVGRVNGHFEEKKGRPMSASQRGLLTAAFLISSIALARVGIIELVAKGYSTMSYLFVVLLVAPLVVWSVRSRLNRAARSHS